MRVLTDSDIRRMTIAAAREGGISPADVTLTVRDERRGKGGRRPKVTDETIRGAVEAHGGDKNAAAKALGISLRSVQSRFSSSASPRPVRTSKKST